MQSLFPSNASGNGNGNNQAPAALTFKAGKCMLVRKQNGSNKYDVTADIRRGTVSIVKNDGILKFRWTDRTTSVVEDDVVIFPDEAVYKKVKTGRECDRCYVLTYKTGNREPYMYWLQDKLIDNDEANATKVNEYLNNPAAVDAAIAANRPPVPDTLSAQMNFLNGLGLGRPAAPSVASATAAAPSVASAMPPQPSVASELQFDLSSILQSFNTLPVPPAATATAATPARNALTAEDLQRAMMGMSNTPQRQASRNTDVIRLEDIVTSDAVINSGVLQDPAVRTTLIQHLPESQRSDEFLEETIRSPQFRQALGSLSAALQSDNYNNVMASLQIDSNAGMTQLMSGDAVGAFLASIQHYEDQQQRDSSSGSSNSGSGSGSSDTGSGTNDSNSCGSGGNE